MVTMGMELSQRADGHPLVADARATKGGKAVSKYIDVDVFIKSFREALPGLKAQVDPDLTPKAYAYLRGGEAIIEDLTKFPAADVVEVRYGRWIEQEKYTFGVMYDCSICDNRILDNGYSWNYCPNCGAKMDKEEV